MNHGYEPQSNLWKQIPQQAAGYYTLLMQDNSAYKLQCASLLKFESHYPPLCPAKGGIQLTNSATLRFRNWSFTIKSYDRFRLLRNITGIAIVSLVK